MRLNVATYKENNFFMNSYFGPHLFLMSCYFTEIFVHLSVVAYIVNIPPGYFSVYKLIKGDPVNI